MLTLFCIPDNSCQEFYKISEVCFKICGISGYLLIFLKPKLKKN